MSRESGSAGRRLLITAGPTYEPIDAVRYIANRSSGRMGLELAHAGRAAGWSVTLLLGPGAAAPPDIRTRRFDSAADLARLLDEEFPACDVLIMAAAVADYRPRRSIEEKLGRGAAPLRLELEPTPDLVAGCAARKRPGQRVIGFALEPAGVLEPRAREKLYRKGLDAIVANPLETMGASEIRAVLYTAAGEVLQPPADAPGERIGKPAFARWLIAWLGS